MKRNYLVLRRHCKICGTEFQPEKAGRICAKCKYKRAKASKQKYVAKHRAKRNAQAVLWAKKNPEKNRLKARRYLWKKRLRLLISQRIPGQKQVQKEHLIAALEAKLAAQHN